MKKLIPVASLAVLVTACTANTKNDTAAGKDPAAVAAPDTVGLAQFQAWKAQNELASVAQYAPAAAAAGVVAQQSVPKARTSAARSYSPTRRSTAPVASAGRSGSENNSGVMASEGSRAAKKKGWSKSAKGAVIGGVAGAAAGAIINKKNRAAGAVIGGVVGAGGGYVIGRKMDKKDGRIDLVPVNNYQY